MSMDTALMMVQGRAKGRKAEVRSESGYYYDVTLCDDRI